MFFFLHLLVVGACAGRAEPRDVYNVDVPLRGERTSVKIPRVLQRMYKDWASKPKYEARLIQSIPVQVTPMKDHSFLMTSLFPESKNATVRKVELWMEFYNVPYPSRVRHTEYSVHIHQVNANSDSCFINATKKPQLRERQIELGLDITSLYVNCRDKDTDYQQLELRMSTTSSSFTDLTRSRVDVFIILQEVAHQDEDEHLNPSAEGLKGENRGRRNKRSPNKSLLVGHVIREFKEHELKDMKDVGPARLTKEFLNQQKTKKSNSRRGARERILAEIQKEMQKQGGVQDNSRRTFKSSVRNPKTKGDRQRRKTTRGRQRCGLNRWYVKFEDIGWNWVIAPPTGFEAYRCHGKCLFPLNAETNSTNHAVVQTLLNSIKGKPKSSCCVPNATTSLTLLFLEDNGIITMKKYPDMIVTSCACL